MAAKQSIPRSTNRPARWAVAVGISQDVANAVAAAHIGDGIATGSVSKSITMPMLGEVDLSLDLTITKVAFTMDPAYDGRLFASVWASGDVSFGESAAMPPLPGRPIVRGDVLVEPRVELRADGRFIAQLDLANSELVTMQLVGIEGADIDSGTLDAMGSMLFGSIGADLFGGLAESMGALGIDLDPVAARPLVQLGVRACPADIVVGDATMVIGLRSVEAIDGDAPASFRPGQQAVVGLSSGALTELALRLAEDSIGLPLPFDVALAPANSEVGARVRNHRLTAAPWIPDLRAGVRTSVAAKLEGDAIVLSPREAWVELPLVPPFVNRINQAVGSLASLAPLSVSVPARAAVPIEALDRTISVVVNELAMRPDGVSCVIEVEI